MKIQEAQPHIQCGIFNTLVEISAGRAASFLITLAGRLRLATWHVMCSFRS
jgi:hypothetical protein